MIWIELRHEFVVVFHLEVSIAGLCCAMGITKLADLIRLNAPDAISHKDIIDYSGNVADLASISLFYFHVFFLSVLSNSDANC